MSIYVKRILNKPIDSNCFVIRKTEIRSCLVIDPGTEDCKELICYLEKKKITPEYIFLTHEHFDHIWGVERLRKIYGCKLIASNECSNAIINPKKNLSIFYDQIGFHCNKADLGFIDLLYDFMWHDQKVKFYKTPGHTIGSICVLIGRDLFTGDTLLQKNKTITKLPGGSTDKLINSIKLIYSLRNKFSKIYPGHGMEFSLEELNYIY